MSRIALPNLKGKAACTWSSQFGLWTKFSLT